MTRENLEDVPTAEWTTEEAQQHLAETFSMACKMWPDIMEPHMVRVVEALDETITELMRSGLRETLSARFPEPKKQHHSALIG